MVTHRPNIRAVPSERKSSFCHDPLPQSQISRRVPSVALLLLDPVAATQRPLAWLYTATPTYVVTFAFVEDPACLVGVVELVELGEGELDGVLPALPVAGAAGASFPPSSEPAEFLATSAASGWAEAGEERCLVGFCDVLGVVAPTEAAALAVSLLSEGNFETASRISSTHTVRATALAIHAHGRSPGTPLSRLLVMRRVNASAKREDAPSRRGGSCDFGWDGNFSPVSEDPVICGR